MQPGATYLYAAIVLALAGAAPAALAAQAGVPAMPRVREEPCTGYCRTTWASCARVALRAAPAERAPIVAWVDSGRLVRVVAGERRTTRPGIVVVRRPHTLVQRLQIADGEITPPHPKRWRLRAGDTIYVVDRETDGDSFENFVWTRRGQDEDTTAAFWLDDTDDTDESAADTAWAVLASEMRQAWWARVRTAGGQSGWAQPTREWSGTSYYDEPLTRCVRQAPAR